MNTLSPEQIASAQNLICGLFPGEYKLKQIYGSQWHAISDPTSFGKMFKATVLARMLQNIRIKSITTSNHHIYAVGKSHADAK